MSFEAERIRLARLSVIIACRWCGEPGGQPCRGPDGKVLLYPHERRQSDWYDQGRPGYTPR